MTTLPTIAELKDRPDETPLQKCLALLVMHGRVA